jgi:hypothetical protein
MIAHNGDTDPHGLIEFMRRVPMPAGIGGFPDVEDAAIVTAFPEMAERKP